MEVICPFRPSFVTGKYVVSTGRSVADPEGAQQACAPSKFWSIVFVFIKFCLSMSPWFKNASK